MDGLAFDHVHLASRDPEAAAVWYVEKLGFTCLKTVEVLGAPQAYLRLGESMLIVRGLRASDPGLAQLPPERTPLLEHFGFRVSGDFDTYCERLQTLGVSFLTAPTDINAATRVAFIEGPDGVRIELLSRREWPDLRQFGLDRHREFPA